MIQKQRKQGGGQGKPPVIAKGRWGRNTKKAHVQILKLSGGVGDGGGGHNWLRPIAQNNPVACLLHVGTRADGRVIRRRGGTSLPTAMRRGKRKT